MIKISNKENVKKVLLSELIRRKEPVTVTELSKIINKTGRTVRNYLDELEDEYRDRNLQIIRKTNVGVYVNMDEKTRKKFKNLLDKKDTKFVEYDKFSSKFRRLYILKILFEDSVPYTIQLFADDLYCSKGTIVNDLIYVENWLKKRNLVLRKKQNQGLWIEGKEKDYRRALKDLLSQMQEGKYLGGEIDEILEKLDYRIDFVNYKNIKEMFPKLDLLYIQDIIQHAEKELGFYFTDQAFLNLITHVAITIERIINNRAVSVNREFLESLRKEREFNVAGWVVKQLSEKFHISFPEEEIGYIAMHMLGAKIQEDYNSDDYNTLLENQDEEYVDIAEDIISVSSEVLNIDLAKDKNLLTRLVLHLRPTVMRLKYGLRLTNPILERIKEEYTSIFGAAWACSSIFENKLGVSINEDEVGYIALHLALAVENMKRKIRAVVVCSSGIGTSQLVALRLGKSFENLEITHILPISLLTDDIIRESDIVITTVRNIQKNEKVVYISTLVTESDLEKVESTLKKLKNSTRKSSVRNNLKEEELDIFDEKLCFLNSEFTDFKEAIYHYGSIMEEMGYAKKGFCKSILEREEKGSTYVGKGIAIPHGESVYVNQSKVCIVKFKEPISWEDNDLEFIIILCLNFENISTTKNFFKNFYTVLESDKTMLDIKNAKSAEEIINAFKN